MSKNLVIVESPSKAKTIGKFLGKDFIVKSSMGHIRDLPKKDFGVDVQNDFVPNYVIDRKKLKIVSELRDAAIRADSIYLASDHDREGEAIAWHLSEILKNEIGEKPVHRILFNEITKKAIQDSVKNPGKIDLKKVESQQARRILDRIVGYDISPVLWKVISKNLSAGRVQSVALRLICERDEEIRIFVPEEYWKIESIVFKDDLTPFKAVLKKWKNKKIDIPDQKKAEELLAEIKKNDFVLDKIKSSKRKVQPSPAYITSTMQQDASRLLNFSARKTMMVAQKLYEGIDLQGDTIGLITYMRTDSLRIADVAVKSCRDLISERFGKDKIEPKTRVYKNKNSAQDAHEAIRPTDPFRTPEMMREFLNKDQLRLYTLIWQRFIATQMIPIQVKSKTVEINAGDALFSATGSAILAKGFMLAFPHTNINLGETIDEGYQNSDILKVKKIEPIQNFTKPPARYSEASLIKELESQGIGRPSTYAAIISTLLLRKYVFLTKKKFFASELGKTVNNFLSANFDELFNVKFTAEMENSLDEVVYGKIVWNELLRDYYDLIRKKIDRVDLKGAKNSIKEMTDLKCEKCGSPMEIKWGRNGQFLGCSNFPTCKNIKNFTKDENGKITIIEPKKLDEKCPECGSDLLLKSGKFGRFIACSNYPKCKFTRPFTLGIKCPQCKDGDITELKSRKGRYFYSCSNYPDCKFITNFKPVDMKCPSCGNYYMEERRNQQNKIFKKCPKCGKEVF